MFFSVRYRKIRKTNLEVSEVGFGLWTVSTGWWGKFTDEDAISLIRKGFDRGINLYDAADTYGNGRSEELLSKALRDNRDELAIARGKGKSRKIFLKNISSLRLRNVLRDLRLTVLILCSFIM